MTTLEAIHAVEWLSSPPLQPRLYEWLPFDQLRDSNLMHFCALRVAEKYPESPSSFLYACDVAGEFLGIIKPI